MTLLACIFLGLLVGSAATRVSMALARVCGIMDYPGKTKIHTRPTPRFGGLGIVLASISAFLLGSTVLGTWTRGAVPLLAGGLVVASTGALDDARGLRPSWKLVGQLIGGLVFLSLGGAHDTLLAPEFIVPYGAGALVFICFMTNSLNLLDGMDGLAAGTTAVISVFLLALALIEGELESALLFSSLAGACLGFLVFNAPPARTFMGDTGSLFLGYAVAVGALDLALLPPVSAARPLGVLLILGVPVADTSIAMVRRLAHRRSVLSSDRFHLYDGLSRHLNCNPWLTLAVVWAIAVICGALGSWAFLSGLRVAITAVTVTTVGMTALAYAVGSIPGTSEAAELNHRS